ncbi:MAG: helix-turn-helix domain-containing protein [Phycisphaeraceae bacterium]|jgi:transcriptional regulator with XRE-family HTH domain
MLAKTFKRIIDKQFTSAKEISELTGVSQSTVYRWIAGQSQPDFDSVRLLVRLLPDARAQKALLTAFTAGTDWHVTHMNLELDVNMDGRVDAEDALDASCNALKTSSDTLVSIREASNGKILSSDETLELISLLNHTVRHCTITQRILVDMAEQRKKRKLRLAK